MPRSVPPPRLPCAAPVKVLASGQICSDGTMLGPYAPQHGRAQAFSRWSRRVRIGLLTEGAGAALLLVHGAMGSIERWEPVWPALTAGRRVTAMDRRGRRSSGDSELYTLTRECGDVTAVASALASEQGGPVDVLGHSFGGTCVLGAAALGAPFRRIVLYEPPGPQTASPQWLDQLSSWIAAGEAGRATFSFLTEIIGLTAGQVEELGRAPGGRDFLPIVAATLLRGARWPAPTSPPPRVSSGSPYCCCLAC